MAHNTQCVRLVELFGQHGNRMTLGQLLQYPVGYKCTSRFSDLRKEGFVITCERGKIPSENLYTLYPPLKDGQLRFA